jgi:hypothetical protein
MRLLSAHRTVVALVRPVNFSIAALWTRLIATRTFLPDELGAPEGRQSDGAEFGFF